MSSTLSLILVFQECGLIRLNSAKVTNAEIGEFLLDSSNGIEFSWHGNTPTGERVNLITMEKELQEFVYDILHTIDFKEGGCQGCH